MGQVVKAREWLAAHPDLAGLSQRKAAIAAGVGLATLQRAIEERKKHADEPTQNRLL